MAKSARFEDVILQVKQLSTLEKIRLIERVAPDIERDLKAAEPRPKPRRSLWGALSDLGTAPSVEEIDQARKEAWHGFGDRDF